MRLPSLHLAPSLRLGRGNSIGPNGAAAIAAPLGLLTCLQKLDLRCFSYILSISLSPLSPQVFLSHILSISLSLLSRTLSCSLSLLLLSFPFTLSLSFLTRLCPFLSPALPPSLLSLSLLSIVFSLFLASPSFSSSSYQFSLPPPAPEHASQPIVDSAPPRCVYQNSNSQYKGAAAKRGGVVG